MGMTFVLRRASDRQLRQLLAQPKLIEHFLFDEPRQASVEKSGLMDRLVDVFGFQRHTSPIDEPREDDDEIDLDKSWHGMHFVMTGSADATDSPLSFIVHDWPEIGDIDVGYGPAKAIKSEHVSRFFDALESFTPDMLRAQYRPDRMEEEELYLAEFFSRDRTEGIEYIEYWLEELRGFLRQCVARKMGLVTYLS